MRQQKINSRFEKCNATSDEIDALDESQESINERFSILEDYYNIASTAQKLITDVVPSQQHIPPNNAADAQNHSTNGSVSDERLTSSGATQRKIKLPPVSIPPFHGSTER